jgi:hypothetical protein
MKKIALLLAIAALALPATAFAGEGKGAAGFDDHLTRATAHVTKLHEKCNVAAPPAKCGEAKVKLTAKLNEWASRIQERIDKLNARPGTGPKKAEHLKTLTDRLAAVQNLIKTV